MYFEQRPLPKSSTGESSPNKSEEVNKDLISRHSSKLPDVPPLTYLGHYTTPLGPNDKYEVVKDGYEVPNKGHTYITLVGEEDEEVYEEVVDAEV